VKGKANRSQFEKRERPEYVNHCKGCRHLDDNGTYCEFLAVKLYSRIHECVWYERKKSCDNESNT